MCPEAQPGKAAEVGHEGDEERRRSMRVFSFLATVVRATQASERLRGGGYPRLVPAPLDPIVRLRRHRFGALVEELADEPSFLLATMFGFLPCYVHGRLVLALADKRPPW